MHPAVCAACGKSWQVPKVDSTYRCRACGGTVAVTSAVVPEPASDDAVVARVDADRPPVESSAPEAAAPESPADDRRSRAREMKELRERARGRQEGAERRQKVANAGKWIAVMAVLFVIGGTITGFSTRSDAEEAHRVTAHLPPTTVVRHPTTHQLTTLGEVLAAADREVTMVFALNYGLAAAMVGIYFWSRKNPLPAMITATAIYALVVIGNAIAQPETLAQGIAVKVLFAMAMVAGIRAARIEGSARMVRARAEEVF